MIGIKALRDGVKVCSRYPSRPVQKIRIVVFITTYLTTSADLLRSHWSRLGSYTVMLGKGPMRPIDYSTVDRRIDCH
jgi:hypothetical protein